MQMTDKPTIKSKQVRWIKNGEFLGSPVGYWIAAAFGIITFLITKYIV